MIPTTFTLDAFRTPCSLLFARVFVRAVFQHASRVDIQALTYEGREFMGAREDKHE